MQHKLNAAWQLNEAHRLLVGAEHQIDEREAAFFEVDGRMSTRTQTQTQTTQGVFVQDEWLVSPKLNVVYGVRFDDTSAAGSATTGNLGASYELHPQVVVRGRLALNLLDSYDADTDRKLDYVPSQRAAISVGYQLTSQLLATVKANYVGEQTYTETQAGKMVIGYQNRRQLCASGS